MPLASAPPLRKQTFVMMERAAWLAHRCRLRGDRGARVRVVAVRDEHGSIVRGYWRVVVVLGDGTIIRPN